MSRNPEVFQTLTHFPMKCFPSSVSWSSQPTVTRQGRSLALGWDEKQTSLTPDPRPHASCRVCPQ